MAASKVVFCDTGFMIRLLDATSELHDNAINYFRYFLNQDYIIRMSTIAVAEYCVKGEISQLPLEQVLLSPFNAYHASTTGRCAKILFDEKSKGTLEVGARVLIQNDVKLLVQAQCEGAEYYLTADSNSKRMFDVLKQRGELSFDFTDIHTPYTAKFGVLDL